SRLASLSLDGLSFAALADLRAEAAEEVAAAVAQAESEPPPDPLTLEQGVYASPVD
ncbi:MAG: pyruvate dehydrogenase (acetyl-transferring) E1 component subunit alpha, partial [Thermoleophilia bacterium]